MLLEHAGRVVTREQLIREVWDTSWFGSTKTLDVHVERAPAQARRRPCRPALHPHGARCGLPLCVRRRAGSVTFRTRLVLAAFYVLTAVVLALVIPLALTVERRAESDFRSAVLGDAAILAARVADLVPQASRAGGPAVGASRSSRRARRDPTRRVVVVNAQGRVVADSAGRGSPGTPFATDARPELRVAHSEGRIDTRKRASETVGDELLSSPFPWSTGKGGGRRARLGEHERHPGERARELASPRRARRRGHRRRAPARVAPRRAALAPDPKLSDASTRLGRGELDARAPEEGPQELESLARSFNRMADSLGGNLEAQREFVANASHQLRTPLTGCACGWRRSASEGGFAAEQAAKAEADLDRLSAIVDDLLALAGASSPRRDRLARRSRGARARGRRPLAPGGRGGGQAHRARDARSPGRMGGPRGRRARPRQPRRQRHPLLARGLRGPGRRRAPRRRRRAARRGHRPRDPAGGAGTCLRALLPRGDRPARGPRARGSGSRSSPRSWSAGAAKSGSSTGPEPASKRCSGRHLPNANHRLAHAWRADR